MTSIEVPKPLDSQLHFSEAMTAISCAHVEAKGAPKWNGGLVKLMGRHSGFITVNAALASKRCELCFDSRTGLLI